VQSATRKSASGPEGPTPRRERSAGVKLLKKLGTGNAEDAADLPALASAIQKQASALGIILLEIV
jgi:hypothetical protein